MARRSASRADKTISRGKKKHAKNESAKILESAAAQAATKAKTGGVKKAPAKSVVAKRKAPPSSALDAAKGQRRGGKSGESPIAAESKNKQSAPARAQGAKGARAASRSGRAPKAKIAKAPGARAEVDVASSAPANASPESKTKKDRAPLATKAAKGKRAASRSDATPKAEIAEAQGAGTQPTAIEAASLAQSPASEETASAPSAAPSARARSKAKKRDRARVKATGAKRRSTAARSRLKPRVTPRYLAAELGQPVDHEGEPIGAGSALVASDEELQAYSLRLWRQMQSGGAVKAYLRAIERAGLTIDQVWTVGISDVRSTSSTADELRRYQQKLLFRANLLEAILSETVAELHRLPGIEPAGSDNTD